MGSLKNITPGQILAVAGGAVILYAGYRTIVFGEAAVDAVVVAVNPANPDNLVNRLVTAIGAFVTDDSGFSVGGNFYEFIHPQFTDFDNTIITDTSNVQFLQ